MLTTSPSAPTISEIWVTRREPSRRRLMCTTRSSAEAIWSRIARSGRSMPAMSVIVSRRNSASRGELACTVDSEPSWPVFIAWSMSSVSAPRTSPTMMRSGRMRSALRTRSRIVTAPRPSMFGGRDSRRMRWSWSSWSSAASSIVTMRSVVGDQRRQHVEQRRLAGAGTAADQDVEPAGDAGRQELGRLGRRACRTR